MSPPPSSGRLGRDEAVAGAGASAAGRRRGPSSRPGRSGCRESGSGRRSRRAPSGAAGRSRGPRAGCAAAAAALWPSRDAARARGTGRAAVRVRAWRSYFPAGRVARSSAASASAAAPCADGRACAASRRASSTAASAPCASVTRAGLAVAFVALDHGLERNLGGLEVLRRRAEVERIEIDARGEEPRARVADWKRRSVSCRRDCSSRPPGGAPDPARRERQHEPECHAADDLQQSYVHVSLPTSHCLGRRGLRRRRRSSARHR